MNKQDTTAAAATVLDQVLRGRFSCRAFLPQPVPQETIEEIFEAAQNTASWNNVQPWQAIVTSGAATRKVRELMVERARSGAEPTPHVPFPAAYEGVYQERRRACGFQLYDAVGVQRGDKQGYARQTMRNFELFDAPHVAVITTEEILGPYALLDCGGYLTNLMNAAQARGVATIAQAALAMHSDALHAHFRLPAQRRIVCAMSFGYADMEHPANSYRVPRAPLGDAVRFVSD